MNKVAPILLLILVVRAEKKIELQDIEDDNLKSEKETEYDTKEQPSQISSPSSGPGLASLDFLRNGFLQYVKGHPQPQQLSQRSQYVHQYDVTEPPERTPLNTQYSPVIHQHQQQNQQPQQAMVGYLSNVPMQIYLVPQYYNEGSEHVQPAQYTTSGSGRVTGYSEHVQPAQYTTSGSGPVAGYSPAPEAIQTQNNYNEAPRYVAPVKTYLPQYSSQPVSYVNIAPTPTIASLLYQLPVVQYNAGAVIAPQSLPKGYYYPGHSETNTLGDGEEGIDESQKQYTSSTDVSYAKSPDEYRYYSARPPPRDEYKNNHISELPHPNSLLIKPSPPHLSHIPKALPIYRPLNKPYSGPSHAPLRQREPPYRRRPTSLLDSYVPSSLQIEYMKRGFTNDPVAAYEALSSGRHFSGPAQRHFERGFLPNQMYHSAGGNEIK
ncbi:Uncharacterized protein OBRU01_09875 [Operophtera brumata]|uniref:Uncharacterized protein n=1 Tax=Operophtera brumata TaxID=104452 RepID=A0A0L7LEL3_OPEBR|nr:Uncharacterized protein OBRU01_09875 [Operophtera brumata]